MKRKFTSDGISISYKPYVEVTDYITGEKETIEFEEGIIGKYDLAQSTSGSKHFNPITTLKLKGITSLEQYAVYNQSFLTSLTLSNNLTSIGDSAFSGCTHLTGIDIPSSLTSIGDNAFRDCTGIKEIIIPDTVISLGSSAFANCTAITKLVVGNGITGAYPHSAFPYASYMSVLQEVYIGTGITSISSPVGGSALKYVYIADGNNLTSISNVCNQCTNVQEVYIGNSNNAVTASSLFAECTSLTKVTLPETLTSIESSVFCNCSALTSITIPRDCTYINSGAFSGCTALTTVNFNNKLTDLRSYAFSGATALTSLQLPTSLQTIGAYAFIGLTKLTQLVIPEGVLTMEMCAIYNCTALTSLTIPSTITTFGSNNHPAIAGLTSVKDFTYLPTSVPLTVNDIAGVQNIETITLGEGVTVNQGAFCPTTCLTYLDVSKAALNASACSGIPKLQKIRLNPEGLPSQACSYCSNLTEVEFYIYKEEDESLTLTITDYCFAQSQLSAIPVEVYNATLKCNVDVETINIQEDAFFNCQKLVNISLEHIAFINIESKAFQTCSATVSLTLYAEDTISIASNAFKGCTGITDIYIYYGNTLTVAEEVFPDAPEEGTLHIPTDAEETDYQEIIDALPEGWTIVKDYE